MQEGSAFRTRSRSARFSSNIIMPIPFCDAGTMQHSLNKAFPQMRLDYSKRRGGEIIGRRNGAFGPCADFCCVAKTPRVGLFASRSRMVPAYFSSKARFGVRFLCSYLCVRDFGIGLRPIRRIFCQGVDGKLRKGPNRRDFCHMSVACPANGGMGMVEEGRR